MCGIAGRNELWMGYNAELHSEYMHRNAPGEAVGRLERPGIVLRKASELCNMFY